MAVKPEQRSTEDVDYDALAARRLKEPLAPVRIHPATKSFDREWVAGPQRPKWLAFLHRLLRIRD